MFDRLPASVRRMSLLDLKTVLDIERQAYDFPWTEGIFRDCLRVGYPSWVYEQDRVIAGYGVMSVASGEGHILNLCVAPDFQGQGIGTALFRAQLVAAEALNVNTLFLEVRASNTVALSLYRKNGFNEIGLRKNYYPAKEGREDAVVLAKQVNVEDFPFSNEVVEIEKSGTKRPGQ